MYIYISLSMMYFTHIYIHILIYVYIYIYTVWHDVRICLFCMAKWCENPKFFWPNYWDSLTSYRFCLSPVDRFTCTEMTTEMWPSAIGLGCGCRDHGYFNKVPWNDSLLILITVMYEYVWYVYMYVGSRSYHFWPLNLSILVNVIIV